MNYRPEIDGLRAVAVLSVIFYHAGIPLFTGGFVGVDIFFVISGYLITGIIYSDIQSGTFSFRKFYERRARRILPALLLVMICALPIAWLLLLPSDMKDFYKSIFFTLIFIPNIFFFRQSGYFDISSEFKPFIHTWSLGVEEQFYFIFPILLLALHRYAKKYLIPVTGSLLLLSLGYSEFQLQADKSASFFLLPSRFWELLIGAFIAIYGPRTIEKNRNEYLSTTGATFILWSIFFYDAETAFPGLSALIPTVGTALILAYGNTVTTTGKLLSSKPIVKMGLISYSAYLWHQAIFAFVRLSSLTPPTAAQWLAAICGTLALAYLSWRFVETPFRNSNKIGCRSLAKKLSTGIVILIAFSAAAKMTSGFESRFPKDLISNAGLSSPKESSVCPKGKDPLNFSPCIVGSQNQGILPDTALLGDSHADAIATESTKIFSELDRKILISALGGCPPLLGVDVDKGNYPKGVCKNLSEKQFEFIKNNKSIKTVILVARWSLYTAPDAHGGMKKYFLSDSSTTENSLENSNRVFEKSVERTIESYLSAGKKIIIVLQVPEQKIHPERLYLRINRMSQLDDSETNSYLAMFSMPTTEHIQRQRPNRTVFENFKQKDNLFIVDLNDKFCNELRCLIGSAKHPYYRDENHLSNHGAKIVLQSVLGLE